MNLKRLAALMMCLVLLCSLSVAAAAEQTPAFNRQMEVLQSGRSIESTTTLKVNVETLGALIAQMQGATSPEATQQFSTLIGALNKLVIKQLASLDEAGKESANLTIGTDKAALLDIQTDVDMTTGENAIATSLLPGIVLKVDQAQMAAMLQQGLQLQKHPETMKLLADKYGKVFADAFAAEVLPTLQTETGTFDIDEGKFDTHMRGDINGVTLGKYMKAVLAVAKEDAELKKLLDPAIQNSVKMAQQAAEANGQQEPVPFTSVDEALDQFDKKLDEAIQTGGDEKLLHLDAYLNSATRLLLVQIDTPVFSGTANLLSVLVNPQENGASAKAALFVKTVTDEAEAAAPIDWAKVKEAALAGEDLSVIVLNVDLSYTNDTAANKLSGTAHLSATASGLSFGLALSGDQTLTGAYQSTAKIALSFLMPEPLAEITVQAAETDAKAEQVKTEGAQVVELKENATEEDMAPLMQVLQEKGLPTLMENLSKALPDEAGLIMQMFSSTDAPETGETKAN